MKNLDHLVKYGLLYVLDDFEGAVFKFTNTGEGSTVEVKFKGEEPYNVDFTTNIATEAFLGGDIITEEQYNKY